MSVSEEQTPIEPPDSESLATVLQELDEARSNLFEASAQYVKRPTEVNSITVVECASGIAASLYRFTKYVIEDDLIGAEQKGEIITTTYIGDDEKRVSFLNGLFG